MDSTLIGTVVFLFSISSLLYSSRLHIIINRYNKYLLYMIYLNYDSYFYFFQRLYDLGARKFVLFSIQPLGCTPLVRTFLNATSDACIEPMNHAALLFNSGLRSIVKNHNGGVRSHMPGASFVYVNSYKIISDIIQHPAKYGNN